MDNTPQVCLTDKERQLLVAAAENIKAAVPANKTPEGVAYWVHVSTKLAAMAEHGTVDGKPAVAVEEQAVATVIDDRWAAVWPRRWVMVRDEASQKWVGPRQLVHVNLCRMFPYRVSAGTAWKCCRPATDEEVAAAAKTPEPAKPEVGEGYREATQDDINRKDREKWSGVCWIAVPPGFTGEGTYRVTVDRIPTDEDAKQRPTVMVRRPGFAQWVPRVLLGVIKSSGFVTLNSAQYRSVIWPHCRFPYPGELEYADKA